MRSLRAKFERFCLKHRNKGIPNLMLWVVIASAIVYIVDMVTQSVFLDSILIFDRTAILQGQVWRLFTYIFAYNPERNIFTLLIFYYFFYSLSRYVELSLGTFKFNLFYFSGVIMMDAFAMLFGTAETALLYSNMAFYLHLSMLLLFATTNPDSRFLVFFIIPVKAWFYAVVWLLMVAVQVIQGLPLFPANLFPLVGLLNYLLFAGSDIRNLFPFLRYRRKKAKPAVNQAPPIQFKAKPAEEKYMHKSTVCGRTDVSHPELEFRYCSRCSGYHCYCQDHINNHSHIE